jgi:hypothetical protein
MHLEPAPELIDIFERALETDGLLHVKPAVAASEVLVSSAGARLDMNAGHDPVMPRYKSGADAAARQNPPVVRRVAPTMRSRAPAPTAAQSSTLARVSS